MLRNIRKLYRITDFSGGLNSETDPTNLAPNEGIIAANIQIQPGRIINRDGYQQITSYNTYNTCKGATSFFDKDDNWRILTTYTDSGNTYVTSGYGNLSIFSWVGSVDVLWDSLTTDTPRFLVESGNVRIGGSHSKETMIFYNFDNKARFNNDANYALDGFVLTNGKIQHPILDYGDTTPDGEYELGVTYSISAGDGTLSAGDTVQYGFTFEYDGLPTAEQTGQESLLSVSDQVITATSDNDKIQLSLYVLAGTAAGRPYDGISERISAINIYRSLNGGDFYFWKRVDINTGVVDDSDTQVNWSVVGIDPYYAQLSPIYDYGEVLVESYSARTGYEVYNTYVSGGDPDSVLGDEHDLEIKWKAAIIAQGHCICGNVKKYGTVYNDRLYISPGGWFDCFPEDRYVELGTGDGDQITALAQLGTRIVVFKKNHAYLYNISSANELNWFVERVYPLGVDNPNAVANCPYGVCFANNRGAWLLTLDGQLKELSRKIRTTYSDNVGDKTIYSAYDAKYDQYYVGCDYVNPATGEGDYIFDLKSDIVTTHGNQYVFDWPDDVYEVVNYFYGPSGEICYVVNDFTVGSECHRFIYHTGAGANGSYNAPSFKTGFLTLDGSIDTYKRTKYLYLTAKNDGINLWVFVYKDGGSLLVYKEISSSSSLTRYKIAIPATLRTISIKCALLQDVAPFELREIAIEYYQKRAK